MDPARPGRLAHVAALLGLRLQANARSLGRVRAPRVEGHEDVVVFGRVPAGEAVWQRKDVGRDALEDARVVSVVTVPERCGAYSHARVDLAGAPQRKVEEQSEVELVLAVAALRG